MLWAVLVVIVEMVAGAPGDPRPCCFDKEFSAVVGDVGVMGVALTNSAFFIDGFLEMSRDYHRDRELMVSHIRQADGSMQIRKELKDYSTRTLYVTIDDGTCTSSPLSPLDQSIICIPDNATFGGTAQFGYGAHTLTTNVWRFPFHTNALDNWQATLTVTQQHCVPVTQSLIGTYNGLPMEQTMFFTGYQPSIADLTALATPTGCVEVMTPPIGRR